MYPEQAYIGQWVIFDDIIYQINALLKAGIIAELQEVEFPSNIQYIELVLVKGVR